MNHIYISIWNQALKSWVAVPEGKSVSKKKKNKKINLITSTLTGLFFTTLPVISFSQVTCTTGQTCSSDASSVSSSISITGANTVLNLTASEISISASTEAVKTATGAVINFKGNADISSTQPSGSSAYAYGANSNINFNKNVSFNSGGSSIRAENYGTITVDGSILKSSNTGGGQIPNLYSINHGTIKIKGDVNATGNSGVGSAVIGAYANSIIDIGGKATLIGGNSNDASVVHATGYSAITIGSLDASYNSTNTSIAGVLTLNGGHITILGDSIIRMESGAAMQSNGSNSNISMGNLIIDMHTADTSLTRGVWANSAGQINLNQLNITMQGQEDYGVHAESNGVITINGLASINLIEDNSIGMIADNAKIQTNNGLVINTNDKNSDAIQVLNAGEIINKNGLKINVKGSPQAITSNSCGNGAGICIFGDKSSLTSTGVGSIQSTAYAIQLDSGQGQTLNLSDLTINTSSTNLALIEVSKSDSNSKINLTNSTASAGNNKTGLLLNVSNSSDFIFEADNSKLYGDIKADAASSVQLFLKNASYLKGSIDPISLSITSDSQWDITENSELSNLVNAGTINFVASPSNSAKKLKVNEYSGGGSLGLNTYLNAGVGSSDILEIQTNASPKSINYIKILNKDGLAVLPPSIGLQVIQAAPGDTQPDSFSLVGGTVAAGIYEYTMYQNSDGNWYLTAHDLDNPTAAPNYNGSVSSVAAFASLAQLYNNASLGTWNERMGDMAYADIQQIQQMQQRASPLWVRVAHERGEHAGGKRFQATATSDVFSPQFNYRTSLLQVGADLLRKPMAEGAYQFAGISFTAGTIKADVDHFSGSNGTRQSKAGTAKINNYSLGAYWTYLAAERSYVDLVGQYTRHSLDGQGPAGSVSGKGHTLAASVEMGKAFALSNPLWALVPQVQLRYQDVKLQSISAKATTSVVGNYQFGDNDSLDLRLGLEARYKFAHQKTTAGKQGAWIRFDVLHEFKGKNTVAYTPASGNGEQPIFTSTRHGTSLNLLGGFDVPVSDSASIYSTAGYRHGLGSNKGHGWRGEVGMRWVF